MLLNNLSVEGLLTPAYTLELRCRMIPHPRIRPSRFLTHADIHTTVIRTIGERRIIYSHMPDHYYRCLIFYEEALDILYDVVPVQYHSMFTRLLDTFSEEAHSIVIDDCRFDELEAAIKDFDKGCGTEVWPNFYEQAYFMLDDELRKKYLRKVKRFLKETACS